MELETAYRVLDVATGASEDVVRDARKVLVKVWHPDRHGNDPELLAHAQRKLREINEAFEVIRTAGYPGAPRAAAPPVAPIAATAPPPSSSPPTPTPTAAAAPGAPPSPSPPTIDFVPRRRLRWPVVIGLCAAVGAGAYFAIVQLGRRDHDQERDSSRIAITVEHDVTTIEPFAPLAPPTPWAPLPPLAPIAPLAPLPPIAVASGATFTLGSTADEVRAAQGEPTEIMRALHMWSYGFSSVSFDGDGKVIGWWQTREPLHVRMEPHDPAHAAAARARGTIHVGSDRDEVMAVQGVPTQIDQTFNTWSYGFSSIEFDDAGKVSAWSQADQPLRVGS